MDEDRSQTTGGRRDRAETPRDPDAWLDQMAASLREPDDPEGEARVMARIQVAASGGLRPERARGAIRRPAWWRWLVEPRLVRLRPAALLAGTSFVAAAMALLLSHGRMPPGSPVPEPQGEPASSMSGPVLDERAGGWVPSGSRPVQFVCLAAGARRVSVVGDFNDWRADAAPLERSGSQGIWSALLWLRPGVYEYAFLVDGEFRAADDGRPGLPADEFGGRNSILIVKPESI